MEGADAILAWDVLGGATTVAGGVLRVDQSGAVLRLVNITDVVDDHAEDERALVGLVGELGNNLSHVVGLGGGDLSLEELGVVGESSNGVHVWLSEGEIVKSGAWLIQVGQVDVMPVGLEGVALTLDVVSKGSALSEWVLVLRHQGWEVLLEDGELSDGSVEDVGVAGLEEGLSLSSDEQVSGAPEGFDLGGEGGQGHQGGGEVVHFVGKDVLVRNFLI